MTKLQATGKKKQEKAASEARRAVKEDAEMSGTLWVKEEKKDFTEENLAGLAKNTKKKALLQNLYAKIRW